MTPDAVPWLPEGALVDARTAEPLSRCLARWSDEWLRDTSLSVPARWERSGLGATDGRGFNPVRQGRGFALMLRANGQLELASALLGREVQERDIRGAADRFVVQQVVDTAISALGASVVEVMPRVESDGGELFVLPVHGTEPLPLLRIEATRPVLVAMARKWAGDARAVEPLAPRRASIDNQTLRISALLGTSRLRLAELETLGVGDVLTLDVPVRGQLNACIEHRPSADQAISLVPGEDRLMLQIERPASQW